MPHPFPAILALFLGLSASSAFAANETAALDRAITFIEESHNALTMDGSAEEKAAALRTALDLGFAFEVWEKFLIRNHIDKFSDTQLVEFRTLLPGFLAGLFSENFGSATAGMPEIGETRRVRKDVLVRTLVPRANGKTLPVDWRIHDFGDRGHLIVDFMVGGTSFLLLKRDEFDGLINVGGPDALISHMRRNAF